MLLFLPSNVTGLDRSRSRVTHSHSSSSDVAALGPISFLRIHTRGVGLLRNSLQSSIFLPPRTTHGGRPTSRCRRFRTRLGRENRIRLICWTSAIRTAPGRPSTHLPPSRTSRSGVTPATLSISSLTKKTLSASACGSRATTASLSAIARSRSGRALRHRTASTRRPSRPARRTSRYPTLKTAPSPRPRGSSLPSWRPTTGRPVFTGCTGRSSCSSPVHRGVERLLTESSYFTSIFVSLGVFLFGYDQGVMSGIITCAVPNPPVLEHI